MIVRLKYLDFGKEKGYQGWARNKQALLQRLEELNINVEAVIRYEHKGTGSGEEWKEADPSELKG